MTQVEDLLRTLSLVDDIHDPADVAARGSQALVRCGGPAALAAEADSLATGPLLPELIVLTDAARRSGAAEMTVLESAVEAGVSTVTKPLVLAYAADALVVCPGLSGALRRPLQEILLRRYSTAREASEGDLAYRFLETMVRLCLAGVWREHRVIAELLDLGPEDPVELTSRVPRLLGVALDVWGEIDLLDVLNELQEVGEARADASVELAMADFRRALSEDSIESIFAGLRVARGRLEAAALSDEARDDAAVYASAIDAIFAFSGDPNADRLASIADELEVSWRRRRAWMSRTREVEWLAPRAIAETVWAGLVATLREAASDLQRASWLQPYDALERVLGAYSIDRTVEVVADAEALGGVSSLVQPVIEGAFIRREGLLAHLRDVLVDEDFAAQNRDAVLLLERVDALRAQDGRCGGDDPGKVWAAAPALAAALGSDVAARLIAGVDQSTVAALETAIHLRSIATTLTRDPLFDQLLAKIVEELDVCPTFTGSVRETFVYLVESTLRFLAYRADIGTTSGGPRVDYLFAPGGSSGGAKELPNERPLQNDYREWLAAGPLRAAADTEVSDVASGRADVKVAFGGLRYLTEVKRELSNASRNSLRRQYTGQAAAYAGTSAELGQLLVLDLTDHRRGFPGLRDSVWVERVPVDGGADRFLVVGVVRGNRLVPSATKGPVTSG